MCFKRHRKKQHQRPVVRCNQLVVQKELERKSSCLLFSMYEDFSLWKINIILVPRNSQAANAAYAWPTGAHLAQLASSTSPTLISGCLEEWHSSCSAHSINQSSLPSGKQRRKPIYWWLLSNWALIKLDSDRLFNLPLSIVTFNEWLAWVTLVMWLRRRRQVVFIE